jgi:hypothetical protein
MDHPFWTEVLSIPVTGQNLWINKLKSESFKTQSRFLQLIVEGFYPISFASLLSFKRVSEISKYPETVKIARNFYDIESGIFPIIPDSPNKNLPHCDQLKLMIQSLARDLKFNISEPETFAIHQKLQIADAKLVKALAFCECIENTAPQVISFYQDFMAQWQCTMNVSSKFINRIYLDEHGLTEGSDSEHQHIQMVSKMMMPYNDLVTSQEYSDSKRTFHALCIEHLNEVYERLHTLCHVQY